jgi:hypothetical protein
MYLVHPATMYHHEQSCWSTSRQDGAAEGVWLLHSAPSPAPSLSCGFPFHAPDPTTTTTTTTSIIINSPV